MDKEKLQKIKDYLEQILNDKEMQHNAKLSEAYSIVQKQKNSKKDFTDNVISDFQKINDTTLGGYIVRDGAFKYPEGTKYKEWDNLKEAYGSLKVVPAFGSKQQDSHTEREDRFIGYWDSFTLVPKGTKGPTKPYVDENYNRIWAAQHTNKNISELSDLDENDLRDLPVSASYEDLGYGNKQIVGRVYHIATSLNKNEIDRCSTENGTPCRINLQKDYAQNSESTIQTDFDTKNLQQNNNNKGVLRADLSQPPTQKNIKKSDARMNIGKKKEEDATPMKKEEEKEDEDEEEEEDMTPKLDMEEIRKLITSTVQESIKAIQPKETIDMNEIKSFITMLKDDKTQRDAKKAQDLKELLTKAPYNYKEDALKEMSAEALEQAKKLREMQSDFHLPTEKPEINKEIGIEAKDFSAMGYNPWKNVSKDFMNRPVRLKEEVLLVR